MKYYPDSHSLLTYAEVNLAIREVFAEHGRGNVQMPSKIYITFPEGDFRTMPASIPGIGLAGVKIVSVHPENPSRNLPTVMATTLLIDPETGFPTAFINATALTDMRTGAGGAVAVTHLAAQSSRPLTLGFVGAGRQAHAQLQAIAEDAALEKILVWSRKEKTREAFAAQYPAYESIPVDTVEKACDCDILITTTPSREPLIRSDWIRTGTHINAIGADAPGKQELDPALLLRSEVFIDDYEQAVHSGEVNVPISQGVYSPDQISGTLGEVVIQKKKRSSPDAITIFDSTGLAIQDLAIARLVVDKMEGTELLFP
ncbi:MAG: ornithine cyclodeaminase family protein [Methanocalculus sp. MSAO_Arc1]|uniref:ornithine cyclodeaminase family protein n=1 Tax=Methanocalculus TaxID=71151 RepID=UPI000FF347DB|nr:MULTISPECIES: ornithine cyclodeaminase family protein [unclassified Methanocalculus]MCP1662476.1 alanine dehydrogenase [Methanocalculus sp. AMF5]RQD80819.1 MAG: ornithine cyclodeaminase family protein [Methanocalculus sp. MSAO_Arc1]